MPRYAEVYWGFSIKVNFEDIVCLNAHAPETISGLFSLSSLLTWIHWEQIYIKTAYIRLFGGTEKFTLLFGEGCIAVNVSEVSDY